ncbi:hypothetical protein QUF50_04985 [Thiotrichales bacterium HSG1]|nr:hypothetical protein [Thiotrichales bacterium HSG1]
MKYLLNLLFSIWMFIGCFPSIMANPMVEQMKEGDLAHKANTLSLLELAFVERKMDYLERISTSSFKKSKGYKFLQRYITSGTSINFNYKLETAIQEFIINGNKRHVLVVDFEKSRERKWSVINAHVMKNGIRQELKDKGFSAMEYDRNFPQFISGFETGKIESYYGLAPYGKLNRQFFKKNKVSTSQNKSLQMKNIIIHRHGKIEGMIFIKLKHQSVGYRDNSKFKSGWLLESAGPMSDLYIQNDNLYIKYLLGSVNPAQLKLNEPNIETGYVDFSQRKRPAVIDNRGIFQQKLSHISCAYYLEGKPNFFRIKFHFTQKPPISVDELLNNRNSLVSNKKIILNNEFKGFFGNKNILKKGQCDGILFWHHSDNGKQLVIDFRSITGVYGKNIGETSEASYIDLYYK